MPKLALILVVLCVMAAVVPGCMDSSAEPAGGPKQAAKPVKTEAVREESVRRTVEVVGTLAAENEVTVSSQAEGVVSRDPRRPRRSRPPGQVLVELDREKLQYNLDQQKAALRAIARAATARPSPAACRRSIRRPT